MVRNKMDQVTSGGFLLLLNGQTGKDLSIFDKTPGDPCQAGFITDVEDSVVR